MTGLLPPEPHEEKGSRVEPFRLSRLGLIRLQWQRMRWLLGVSETFPGALGTVFERRQVRREKVLMPGELMVATRLSATALGEIVHIVQGLSRLTDLGEVSLRASAQGADPERTPRGSVGYSALAPLASNYFRLGCRAGQEQFWLRSLRIMARHVVPRPDLEVVRSARLRPATAAVGAPGPIVFTPALDVARAAGWLSEPVTGGADCQALLVDFDHPDQANVRDVWPIMEPGHVIRDGHATVMAATFRHLAPDAKLDNVAMGPAAEVGSWSLLDAVTASRNYDLIFAGVELTTGLSNREGRARQRVIGRWLSDISGHAPYPVLIFPTGNANHDEPADTIAVPACLPGVVAIGAIDTQGRRSAGSRFRRREAPEPAHWWMVPGGDFPQTTEETCLVTMAGRPQAGTSIATGFAAGLLAGLLAERRDQIRLGRGWLQPAIVEARDELLQLRQAGRPDSELQPLVRAIDALEQLNAPGAGALDLVRQRSMAAPVIPNYQRETCGLGLLRVAP